MAALQWSHDLSAVEMAALIDWCGMMRELQWSHDLSAVEIAGKFSTLILAN